VGRIEAKSGIPVAELKSVANLLALTLLGQLERVRPRRKQSLLDVLRFDELEHVAHGLNEVLMTCPVRRTQRGFGWFFTDDAGQASKQIDCGRGNACER